MYPYTADNMNSQRDNPDRDAFAAVSNNDVHAKIQTSEILEIFHDMIVRIKEKNEWQVFEAQVF